MAKRVQRRYTIGEKNHAKALVASGLRYADVAATVGVPIGRVEAWASRGKWDKGNGHRAGSGYQLYTKEQLAQARRLAEDPVGYTRSQVAQMSGVKYSTLTTLGNRQGWQWAAHRKRSGVPSSCNGCQWPEHERCSQHWCACEQEILVLGQPEALLWANNGGREVLDWAY